MDFSYTETQKMIAETIKDFGAQHIKPFMMDWDNSQEFPVHVFKALGELGLIITFLLSIICPTKGSIIAIPILFSTICAD